jgi:branched-chain amino acid transport system permease protein
MSLFLHWEPVLIVVLLNIVLVTGLYVTALSGQLSLATAAVAGIGGYTSAVLTTNFGWWFLPAVLMGAGAGGAVGAFLALLTLRMRDFILKLVTLAFGEAVVVVAFNFDYIGGANSFTGIPAYTDFRVALIAAAIAVFIAWRFDGSRLGFAARAVRDDPTAAGAIGVSIRLVRTTTFFLGGAICGAGGAIQAHYTLVLSPQELGFFVSLNYIIFLLFGGIDVLWGALLGAVILTVLPESLRFAAEYRMILYGFVITLVILFRPRGLATRVPTGAPGPLARLFGHARPPASASPGVAGKRQPRAALDEPRG